MDLTKIIGETLKELFPDIKQIRRNKLEQGYKPHSFYIKTGRVLSQNQLFSKQMRLYPFILHYYPEKYPDDEMDQSDTRCAEIGERLLAEFHHLKDYKGKVNDTSYEVHDGVLLFYFRVRMRTSVTAPVGTPMGALEERSNLIDE